MIIIALLPKLLGQDFYTLVDVEGPFKNHISAAFRVLFIIARYFKLLYFTLVESVSIIFANRICDVIISETQDDLSAHCMQVVKDK